MARRSQWRLWTLSATLIVLLRAGWIAVMTVVLQNGSARQLTPRELAELNGEAPAHSGRQSRPGHDRRRKSLLHGASRPSGSTPATRRGRAAASPPTGVPLQTFQRGWFEQYIKEGKNAIKWTRLSCRTFAANVVRLQLHTLAYNLGRLLSASGVMEARGGGFGYDDGSRRSAVAGEHEGFLSSWPQRTRSTSHPCSMTRNASPWCASTAGQRASVVLDAAATR